MYLQQLAVTGWRICVAMLVFGPCASLFALGCADGEDNPTSEKSKKQQCDSEEAHENSVCVEKVTGRVVDELDGPVVGLQVTICGPTCSQADTNDSGEFSVDIYRYLDVSEYSIQPHGTPSRSTFYHAIPANTGDGDLRAGTLRIVDLNDEGSLMVTKTQLVDRSDPTAPRQKLVSGDVSLVVHAETEIRLSLRDAAADYPVPSDQDPKDEGRRFRARELESGLAAEFSFELAEEARVFALGPFEAKFTSSQEGSSGVSIQVVNTTGWQAGTTVDVLALGSYLDAEWLTPSALESIGLATVSEDGAMIELSANAEGAGLKYLTWLALVPAS